MKFLILLPVFVTCVTLVESCQRGVSVQKCIETCKNDKPACFDALAQKIPIRSFYASGFLCHFEMKHYGYADQESWHPVTPIIKVINDCFHLKKLSSDFKTFSAAYPDLEDAKVEAARQAFEILYQVQSEEEFQETIYQNCADNRFG